MKKLIMLLALVGALSLISVASAQFTSSQTWGSFGNENGQFYGMSGIATDTSGNIYVAELDNRVQKFSENGTYLTQFNIPARSIAIDSAGNIYATVSDSIQKFDSAGTLLNTWGSTGIENGSFKFPTGIALDSSRNMYVSDMENNRIQKLDSSGKYVTSWGTLGSGNGNFKSPAGIAVSGDYVYVADTGNYRIQKFDLNGSYVSSLGSKGTGNTQFNGSIAVASDSAGNIYVADYYNGRVLEYDSNFNYLNESTGFSYPTALVKANNNLYVLDSGNYLVRIASYQQPPDPPKDQHRWGSFGNKTGQFYGISGIAADTFGNIYVVELDNRVQKFSGNGTYLTQFNIPARDIAIDSAGNIYATVNDSIQKFNSTGALLNTWGSTGTENGSFKFPTGIALDSSGNIYVSDMENNRTQKLNSSGNYVTSWGTSVSGNGSLNSPTGITVSGNYVYVADMGNYRMQKFDLNGNYISSLGSKGTNNTQFNSSIAVANDSSGNIYVADYYNGRVLEYDSNFSYLGQYTGLSYPTALDIANDNLYVLDSGNYQVVYYNNSTNNSTNISTNINWSDPSSIIYGTALSSIQLNAVATDPITGNLVTGNFTYTPISGTVLGVGTHTLHVDFTPDDAANYTNASKDVTINVLETLEGELQLWTFDASKVSDVPNNIYTASKENPYTSNVSLTYNSTLGSIDSTCLHGDSGETYFTGAYPTVDENLTFTMGVDSNSPWSYGYIHTSVAYVGVRHASDGSYEIKSYWTLNNGNQSSSSFQIPATSVVNNRVTVSIHSYDSNRTNVITSGPTLNITTPYTTETTRKLPYTNVIQPLIYEDCYASGIGGWVNVHLYNITQSIPRNIITPYARNDIMGFGLDYPNATNNQKGTDLLISQGQSASVYLSGNNMNNTSDVAYDKSLFDKGFEEGIHFYPGLATESLEQAQNTIDTHMKTAETTFGSTPASWSSSENKDNVTHAIYAYNKYGALYRNGPMGMDFITNVDTLTNATWAWWSVSSEHGAVCPCFTHQTDNSPAIPYSIDPDLFRTFVTNLNSNDINLVSFSKWYYSSMAQIATTNILQSDENSMKFQLNTSGGYPVNMNVQTMISPSHLDCNGVLIPFKKTSDGIQFMSVGNGTYTLTTGPVPLFANFSANKTKGFAPLTIQFNDSSKNVTSVNWNFGDGNNSTERNPIHKFATQGNYTVNLTAANENGTDSKLATINVYEHLVFPGCTNPPTDPDQDDHYEDINGNGILDFDDIVVLYHNIWWIKEKARVTFFDFNSNTLIDFNDVIKLYDMKKQKI